MVQAVAVEPGSKETTLIWQAPEWTVHLFSGEGVRNDPLRDLPGLIEVDVRKGWDLNNDKIYGVLLWAARSGRIKHVIGGPPAATFMPFRYRGDSKGPQPVRSTLHPWGMPEGLGHDDRARVKNENVMLFKMVWLWAFAEAATPKEDGAGHQVGFCLEYPEDPQDYLPEGAMRDNCVSPWRTEFMKLFLQETKMTKYQFEQGALGHMMRRPTCCASNLSLGIHGLRDSRTFVDSEDAGGDQTIWPHGFRLTLVDAIHVWKTQAREPRVQKAMTKADIEEWKAHIERGHWPYRRDCAVCLAAAGTGRPARRVLHRDAYVLSLDIAGPFAEVGRDEVRGARYRFVLAATYSFPKVRETPVDAPIPDEEEAEQFLVEEEPIPGDGEDGPEDPGLDAQEEDWRKKIADLNKPMELQTLKFSVPLERHRGKEVLEALQDIYVKLRSLGLPLNRVHSDKGREFRVKPLRKWCKERDIYQTFTEGVTPTQNAAAESHVKWLKARARMLITASGLEKELWPCAMKHACHLHNARQLDNKLPTVRFGGVVWVKSKKDRGPFDPRWERGTYVGPADDVREGHVIRLDDGLWLRTLHMRTVRDDEIEEDEDSEEHVVDLIEPERRLRGKTRLTDPEMRALTVESRKDLMERLLASDIWDSSEARVERPQLRDGEVWDQAAYVSLGAYQHGGITSITRATEKFTAEAQLAARLLAIDHPGRMFTSVVLVKNAVMPVHKDSYNDKQTLNLVSPLKVSRGSTIWQEMRPGDEFHGSYKSMMIKDKEVPGQLFSVERPATIRPDRLHAPLRGEPGDRVVVVGCTVSKWEKLLDHQREDLEVLGFQLPDRKPRTLMLRSGREGPSTTGAPPDSAGASTVVPPSGSTAVSGRAFLGPGSSTESGSTLQRPGSRERMEVSSSTPGPLSETTVSSGPRSRAEYLPEMGGERLDALVVPGGRVELRLRWAIRYVPIEPEAEEVLMTSNPILPLGHDEEQRLRSRATWLSEFVEEEREIRARQAERGEYPTQRERQVFYRLDEALDYINELLATSHQARQAQGVSLMRMAVTPSTSENVEEILSGLTKPLEVVHNVELQEVKRNLQRWIPSLEKEMETLTKSGTLIPIPLPMAKEKAAAGEIVLVPAKTVHTAKPPGQDEGLYKRRSRIVICGNFIGGGDVDVYTAAASAESVRCALTVGAKKGWCGAVTDVNSAFTLTPMTESTVKYAITIPKVVVDAGCAPTNTAYMVDRVLYGLREAPRLWGSYRDRRVTRARFKVGNKLCMFIQMETDPSVWRVVEVGKESNTVALMVIYVDDVMMLGPMEYVEAMYQWLTVGSEDDKGWKCSPLEWLGKEPVRYLGMDVRRKEADNLVSYHISQGSYVTELLKAYPQEASRPSHVPATKDVMPFNEESIALSEPSEERVREAQKMAGELLWLVTRTRPDVGYSTAHVCAAATRNPEGAIRLAKLTMRYLAATPDLGLRYDGGGDPVVAYSDASFAPQGDRSFGCVTTATYGGFTAWRMTKQPTVVLSAAEAELVELLNARQQAAGLQAWLEEVVPDERGTPTLLCVDNTAAGGLATTSPGSWKTRHLKVKASHLRLETSEGRIQ